ncbi:ARM repeat-containing protein [Tricholoma matsutake]|nr:ARM repeat-containing protein [Tricholoma matsutake 945]
MPGVTKAGKKRPAQSQAGPKAKKILLEKTGKPEKKRSRPVTAAVPADDGDSESLEDLDDLNSEQGDEWVDEEGRGDEEHAMDQDFPQDSGFPKPKDANAARESHKAQKALQSQRRAFKPNSSLLADAKRIWSLARQKNIGPKERQKHVADLMGVIRGKVKEIVLKHDASRIVQTLVKYGRQAERDEVAVELKGHYRDLAQHKYSKFLVTKLIRLSPTHRASILLEFQSYVQRLLLHREASFVLADAFDLYANAYERSILLRDFYGRETALFSASFSAAGSAEDKERAKKGLLGVLEAPGMDEEKRRRVLAAVKGNLVVIFNNPDKGAITHSIVHRALWEYLTVLNDASASVSDEAEREKMRREIFESCQDVLAEMVHTKDGSRAVREFLAHGSAKDRKQILKVLKPHVERICLDDEAQLVLFTALDVVDDTKLLSKSILSSISTLLLTPPPPNANILSGTPVSSTKLYTTPQGRRSLLYPIITRSPRHFTPSLIGTISQTDALRLSGKTSKKDTKAREEEVRKAVSADLMRWVKEKVAEVVREPGGALVVAEVMLFAEADKKEAIQTLLGALTSPYPSSSSTPHPIDLPHTSRLYKILLQGGHFNHSTSSISLAPTSTWDRVYFAREFVRVVGREGVVGMCTEGEANGAFVVAELCGALIVDDAGDGGEREEIKRWFDEDVRRALEEGRAKGKKVLLEKIALL